MMPNPVLEVGQDEFFDALEWLKKRLAKTSLIQRGRVHAQDVSTRPEFAVHELHNVVMTYDAPATIKAAQTHTGANLPWAEDHFQERVSGIPYNPAPSEQWWPFRVNGNKAHKNGEKFSHTYPERIWPKRGGDLLEVTKGSINLGLRYAYGDLKDVVDLLAKDPFTRQAYLPIWFPEDTGASQGQRVPCTLGYHFIRRGIALDCQYFMRSCDIFRHFPDDVYMAVRLMQWVVEQLADNPALLDQWGGPFPTVGKLTMVISNLHCFKGDEYRL